MHVSIQRGKSRKPMATNPDPKGVRVGIQRDLETLTLLVHLRLIRHGSVEWSAAGVDTEGGIIMLRSHMGIPIPPICQTSNSHHKTQVGNSLSDIPSHVADLMGGESKQHTMAIHIDLTLLCSIPHLLSSHQHTVLPACLTSMP